MYPKHLLNQTIKLYGGGTDDDYGQKTGNSGVDHKARVEFVNKTLGTRDGQAGEGDLVIVNAKIWIAPDVTVEEHAKVDYDGQSYRVELINKIPNGQGKIVMQVLECSEWRA